MASELLSNGVPLDSWIRIYEVKGLTHVTRDLVYQTLQPSDGDALGCFVSAAIHNMREMLRDGQEPPISRIAGRILDGNLVIDLAGGITSVMQPIAEDPMIDIVNSEPGLIRRPIGPAETERWLAVTASLAHESDAIIPPTIACRVGGYRLRRLAAQLSPFPSEQLSALYENFEGYSKRVKKAVAALERARLYDSRVESAKETAERSRPFFAE